MKKLATKINQFSYFSPSFDLKTRVVTLTQSIVGLSLTIFSLVLVILTVIEGYDHYYKIENISISSTSSFNEVTPELSLS